ncbi:hypothetical protein OHA37_16485 [Streptomyces sp. NBC_00335]|uniref:hypothetical protein n=1 Tax=unclassified Streptomyces TaxID=2593676 RepID=UPI00224D24C8|nr:MULTISPECIES: hypothetical protein [unclassified Streptomyces]MCX5405479.1 hypothetical protein [Streptomyces sp. NBC_00086]
MTEHADAVGMYESAAKTEAAALRRSDWYTRYLWVFAAGQLALVPLAVLWHGLASALAFGLGNTLLVTGLSVYAARQRVVRRGFGLKHGLVIGSWAVLFALSVSLGTTVFAAAPAFAAVAAPACALPPAVGAWLESRRAS